MTVNREFALQEGSAVKRAERVFDVVGFDIEGAEHVPRHAGASGVERYESIESSTTAAGVERKHQFDIAVVVHRPFIGDAAIGVDLVTVVAYYDTALMYGCG